MACCFRPTAAHGDGVSAVVALHGAATAVPGSVKPKGPRMSERDVDVGRDDAPRATVAAMQARAAMPAVAAPAATAAAAVAAGAGPASSNSEPLPAASIADAIAGPKPLQPKQAQPKPLPAVTPPRVPRASGGAPATPPVHVPVASTPARPAVEPPASAGKSPHVARPTVASISREKAVQESAPARAVGSWKY